MATRTYYSAEYLPEVTTTSVSYVDVDSLLLQFTPGNNETFLIVATWLVAGTVTNTNNNVKLVRTAPSSLDLNENIIMMRTTSDYQCGGCFCYETYGTSPGQQTYKIQFAQAGGDTAKVKQARIIALKLESGDQYNSSTTRSTHTGDTNWTDKVSLTVSGAGDYLVLASATVDGPSWEASIKVRLDLNGSTQYDTSSFTNNNTINRRPWAIVKKLTLADSDVLKIQYGISNASYTVGIAHAYIILLKLSNFDASYYGLDETREGTTNTSYVDQTTVTQTLPAVDHLILASCGGDYGYNYTNYGYWQLDQSGTSIGESIRTAHETTDSHIPFFWSNLLAASAQSYTWKQQWKTNSATYTAGIQDARIAVLQLEQGQSLYTRGNYSSLPANDTALETSFSANDIANVAANDSDYVDQAATGEYAVFQFKANVSGNACNVACGVQSNIAGAQSTVYLQIFDRIGNSWTTIANNNTFSANTDFDLSNTVANLANYVDANNQISCRVYQQAQ